MFSPGIYLTFCSAVDETILLAGIVGAFILLIDLTVSSFSIISIVLGQNPHLLHQSIESGSIFPGAYLFSFCLLGYSELLWRYLNFKSNTKLFSKAPGTLALLLFFFYRNIFLGHCLGRQKGIMMSAVLG